MEEINWDKIKQTMQKIKDRVKTYEQNINRKFDENIRELNKKGKKREDLNNRPAFPMWYNNVRGNYVVAKRGIKISK